MPNHVTNRVVVTGPSAAIAAFRAAFLVEDVEADEDGKEHPFTRFDFNRVIPRPKILDETESGSSVSMGLLVLGRPEIMDDGFGIPSLDAEVARYLSFPWVKEAGVTDYEGLKTFLAERHPECTAKAEIAIRAHEECGHASWYSWSLANWGTKWNAYSFEVIDEGEGRFEFRFDTAWSPPEPVFDALADRPECEDLRIDIQGFDEGWNFAYRAEISCGCFAIEGIPPTRDLYAEIYGEPCVDEDDEGEDPVPGAAIIRARPAPDLRGREGAGEGGPGWAERAPPGSPFQLSRRPSMTDKPNPEAIDINAIVARHFVEQAEHNLRAEALRPANKAALFDALAAAGVTQVVVAFDGYGDSGQVEGIDAHAGDRAVELPDAEITICSALWGADEIRRSTMSVHDAIEQLAYDLLAETHGGWENNDGAFGEFTFDVATRSISLDYNERFASSEYYGHEF